MCQYLSPVLALLGAGPVVAVLVQLLKRIAWVRAHTRVVVTVLTAVASVVAGAAVCGVEIGQILTTWIAALSGATATYEYVMRPIRTKVL